MSPKKAAPPTQFNFKYVSFSKRLAGLNVALINNESRVVDDLARIDGEKAAASSSDILRSHFVETVERCRDLDFTTHFKEFSKKLPYLGKVTTLSQVLHESKTLARVLYRFLASAPDVSLSSLLDLTVALAQDLRHRFYKFFWRFYDVICARVAGAESAEVIELCFSALTQMFRFLWRVLLLKENIEASFDRIFELLASHKGYIRRFTGEAASFLVRKIPEELYEEFWTFCIRRTAENASLCSGVADLLASSLKGSGKHFHSSAASVVSRWVDFLTNEWDCASWVALRDVFLTVTDLCIAFSTTGTNGFDLFYSPLQKSIVSRGTKPEVSRLLLESAGKWLKYKSGLLVTSANDVLMDIVRMMGHVDFNHVSVLLPGLGRFIIGRISDIDKHLLMEVVSKVFSSASINELQASLDFAMKLVELGAIFDGNLLQYVVQFAGGLIQKNETLPLEFLIFFCKLAKERQGKTSTIYSVCRSDASGGILSRYVVEKCLNQENIATKEDSELKSFLCALYLLPHVDNGLWCSESEVEKVLNKILSDDNTVEFESRCLAYFARALTLSPTVSKESLARLLPPLRILELAKRDDRIRNKDFLHFLTLWTSDVGILAQHADNSAVVCNTLVQTVAEECFAHSDAHVRRAAVAFCASATSATGEPAIAFCASATMATSEPALSLLRQVEHQKLDAVNYRERIRLLRQATLHEVSSNWLQYGILRYLLGSLYVNFQLLWPPLIDMIGEIAGRLSSDEAMSVVFRFLATVTSSVRERNAEDLSGGDTLEDVDFENESFGKANLRPDHGNARVLVLKAMQGMARSVEVKHREFIPLLLDFVSSEYDKVDPVTSQRVNLVAKLPENLPDDASVMGEDLAEKAPEIDQDVLKRTLVAYLDVLKSFQNPKAVYQSPKVTQILEVLFTSPSPLLQNVALRCFFAYRLKWLAPYREQLEKLMSREGFSEQIVDFGLDLNSNIQSDERGPLVGLLLKICYGQLLNKSEKRKGGAKARRAQIFRFLGTCSKDELKTFVIDLTLKPLSDLMSLDLSEAICEVAERYTLDSAIPPRKLLGMLSSLSLAFGNIPTSLEHLAPKLVQALLIVGGILRKMESAKFLRKWVKILKRDLIRRLIQLWDVFEYEWSDCEKEILHDVVISPGVAVLSKEAVSAPTSVLKLMTYLAQKPDFVSLLCKPVLGGDGNCCLTSAMALLDNETVSAGTHGEVMALCANLTSIDRPDLLVPFAQTVLDFTKRRLSANVKATLSSNDVTVLLSLTELCADPDSAAVISRAILGNLAAGSCNTKPETALPLLQVAAKLAPIASEFPVPIVAKLLLAVQDRTCRNELFNIVAAVSKQCGETLVRASANLESRMGEPDYEMRFAALAQIRAQLKVGSGLATNDLICYIHALAHEIVNCEDLSLRDGYSFTLQAIATELPRMGKTLQAISTTELPRMPNDGKTVKSSLVDVVKLGLNSSVEEARFEFLMVLRAVILAFPADYPDVFVLLSTEDPDLDFLKNLTHIQIPRRAAALRKISMNAQVARFSVDFLQPILMAFLKDPAYVKQNVLHDDVIGYFGNVYSFLPWKRYRPFFLHLMKDLLKADDTKTLKLHTKLMVAILSAYHYDQEDSKAVQVMRSTVIPELSAFIAENTRIAHQKSQGYSDEKRNYERDLCKAPLVLGIIRVLKHLPENAVEDSLPNLVSKLCYLLRSSFYEVRESARKNLIALVRLLGPKYLKYIVTELRAVLTRGFHQEVMLNSVNILIGQLQNDLQPGDLDPVIPDLLSLTNMQLFQDQETRVDGGGGQTEEILTVKLPERKAAKAIQTYRILGRFASEESIGFLLSNVKSLVSSGSFRKSSELALMERLCSLTADGLAVNTQLELKTLLVFAHSIVTDVKQAEQREMADAVNELDRDPGLKGKGWVKPDAMLIEAEPKRTGATPVRPKWTLDHVLVEFALDIILQLFKKEKLVKSNPQHAGLLNPFARHVVRGIRSQHVRIVTLALRTLGQMIPFRLADIEQAREEIIGQLFVLMNQWSRIDSVSSQSDVLELNLTLFKVFTAGIRELGYELSAKQKRVVLQYAEQVLSDSQRSHAGFAMLRVLCAKRGGSDDEFAKELKECIDRLRVQMIRQSGDTFKARALAVLAGYLKGGSMSERTEFLRFFLVQLDYSEENGRMCALEMLFELLMMPPPTQKTENFEESVLVQAFLHLVAFYNNEQSEKCRKSAYVLLKRIVGMVTDHSRDELLKTSLTWLESDKSVHHRIGLMILKLAIELNLISGEDLQKAIDSGAALIRNRHEEDSRDVETSMFQVLRLFSELLARKGTELSNDIKQTIWHSNLLVVAHPHSWIMLESAKIIGHFLSEGSPPMMSEEFPSDAFELIMEQARLIREDDAIFDKILENLVLLCKRGPVEGVETICKSLARLCKPEITGSMKSNIRRMLLFRWLGRIANPGNCIDFEIDPIDSSALVTVLGLLFREMLLTKSVDPDLKVIVDETADLVKRRIGSEKFALLLTDAKKVTLRKRRQRKQEEAIDNLNPLDADGIPKKRKKLKH